MSMFKITIRKLEKEKKKKSSIGGKRGGLDLPGRARARVRRVGVRVLQGRMGLLRHRKRGGVIESTGIT